MEDAPGLVFGGLLRAYRERAVQSQDELARRCGLSVRAIRYLESGRVARPRAGSVRLLADALELVEADRATLVAAARPEAAAAAPHELPPAVPDFTGRDAELAELLAALDTAAVVGVAGPGGVGKTALAVQAAHRVTARFPDGQLYADLRGPVPPAAVLDRFLRALGVPGTEIPADEAGRAAAYRSALAGRRVLVLLDDAADAAQVRPLLPGDAGSAVLVTGRSRLAGLPGARLLDLAVLPAGVAVELLGRVAGADRVAAEPAAAAAVAGFCGGLPLAVRIAGARLAARPGWPVERLRVLLADEHRRLDELATGDLAVRASLALSEAALGEAERRAFRALGAAAPAEFAGWVLAPLLDVPVPAAERLAEALVDAQLLEPSGADRYRFHDLVRLHAREQADPDAAAAADRLTAAWLALAEEADRRLPSASEAVTTGPAPRHRLPAATVDALLADPLDWLDRERTNLVAAVGTAPAGPAWELLGRLFSYLLIRSDWAGIERATAAALAATRDDPLGAAVAELYAGWVAAMTVPGGYGDGCRRIEAALATFTRLGDAPARTVALLELAFLAPYGPGGGPVRQLDLARRALDLAGRTGELEHQAKGWVLVGKASQALGRPADAAAAYERAMGAARRAGAGHNEADALWRLVLCPPEGGSGPVGEATRRLGDALAVMRRLGDRVGQARVLAALARVALDAGHLAEAEARLAEAFAAWPPAERRPAEPQLHDLRGRLRSRQGRPAEAAADFRVAAEGWGRLGDPAAAATSSTRAATAATPDPHPTHR